MIHLIKCASPVIPPRIEDTVLLENFSNKRNDGIDRIGNHKDEGLGAGQGDASGKIPDDTSVDLTNKQVSPSANAGRDNRTNPEQIIPDTMANVSVFIVIIGG